MFLFNSKCFLRSFHCLIFFKPPVRDALDAFIFQRVYLDRKQNENNGGTDQIQDLRKKYPPQLLRRLYDFFFGITILLYLDFSSHTQEKIRAI